MVIIILLVAIIAFFYLMGINLLFPIPETAYYYIFSSIVQSEAAIFGILFILLTFGLQYVSNKYQINTLKIIENSREIKSSIRIVIFSMITNLIALSLIRANWTIFSIAASLGIGSAFYFILSLYDTLKYTIKLSSLSNITNALVSSTPRSMEEFYQWLGRLKDIVGPVLVSSDSIESKLIYLGQILPTVRSAVSQMVEYLPQDKKIEHSVETFWAIIEPAVKIQQYGIIKAVVPEAFKYLEGISPEASKKLLKRLILLCDPDNFKECLEFVLYECILQSLQGKSNCGKVNNYYRDFLIFIHEIIDNSLRVMEKDSTVRIEIRFLQTTLTFFLESLKSPISTEQKKTFFTQSISVFMALVRFFKNLSKLPHTKYSMYKRSVLHEISMRTNEFGRNLEEFAKENGYLMCNKELLKLHKEMSKLSRPENGLPEFMSARVYLEKLVNILSKECKQYSTTYTS